MFCLPKNIANTFLDKVKLGEIDPESLSKLSTSERRAFFSTFMGEENAKQVNTLFESKILLENQQKGMIDWAKQVAGLKPEVRKSIIDRVNKMTEILNPENEQSFLADLADHKLGITVTMEEAGHISELARITSEAKKKMLDGTGDRKTYGRAWVAFRNYKQELVEEHTSKLPKDPIKLLTEVAGNSKSMASSMDNSAIFKQGWKAMLTHPRIWFSNALSSFGYLVKSFGGKQVMDEIDADIISRPTYDLMQKGGLAIGVHEEQYPTSWASKIPILGRAYKASESAFTGFVHKLRADIFDNYIDIASKSGVDINDTDQIHSISKLVNSLTGRGSLGQFEPAADFVNSIFFSPRLLKSHIDVLTIHSTDPNFSAFARKQAAINLVKVIVGSSAILATAEAIHPGSVDWDRNSSNYGKIKIGKTRFDVTGGMSSLVTLVNRLITRKYKSSTSGKITSIDSGKFGSTTGKDLLHDFADNKLSPVGTLLLDMADQRDYNKKKITFIGEAGKLVTPLSVANYFELRDNPDSADLLLSTIADALGISTNTY